MAVLKVGAGLVYTTIQAAVTAQSPGGTVEVLLPVVGSSYPEAVTIASKRIRLYSPLVAADGKPLISITGAGGGAAAAVTVTGTGGIHLENFNLSNVGSAATIVATGINANDYFRRLIIDGGGGMDCLRGSLVDSCILKNGRYGINVNYNALAIWRHLTVVNMTTAGWLFGCGSGVIQACLAQNCNGVCYQASTSLNVDGCCWNLADDLTAPGQQAFPLFPLADVSFVNYAGGDLFLTLASAAWVSGVDFLSADITGRRVARDIEEPRIYLGAHDPSPTPPAWITGASTVRSF